MHELAQALEEMVLKKKSLVLDHQIYLSLAPGYRVWYSQRYQNLLILMAATIQLSMGFCSFRTLLWHINHIVP